MFEFLVLIIAIIVLSFGINMLLLYSVGGLYRIFVAPGIILHELSHAFGCLITLAPIESINVFKKDGGEVKHGKSKIPVIGQLVISLAPFIVGAQAIYFLSKLLGVNSTSVSDLNYNFSGMLSWVKHAFANIDIANWKSWVAMYLVLSIAVTMTPSVQDMKNISLTIVVIAIIGFVLKRYLDWHPNLSFLGNPALITILTTTLVLLLFGLVLSILVFAIKSLIKPV